MTMVLPRYVVVKSKHDDSCLKYVSDAGDIQGFLQFNRDEVLTSPKVKMEVELAETGENTLVHIRSCYNNKYWARNSDTDNWITASAAKKNEDPSNPMCTLFKPEFPDGNYETVHFKHVQLGLYVYSSTSDEAYTNCLFAGETSSSNKTACAVTDFETILILPRFVAFKGPNGNYMRCSKRSTYLCFDGTDISDPAVGLDLSAVDADGSFAINSRLRNCFWTATYYDPSYVEFYVDAKVPPESYSAEGDAAMFKPFKVDENVIALRSKKWGSYCYYASNLDQLCYGFTEINNYTHLQVEEYVTSREIYDVNFRLSDSRIYNQTVKSMTQAEYNNWTQETDTAVLTLTYTDSKSSTWSNTVTLTFGVTMTIQAGVPMIDNESIQISEQFSGAYQWGQTNSTSEQKQVQYTVPVAPMTKVTVEMIATVGFCDVPFDYAQRDTLPNGDFVISVKNDGLYTGVNAYHFQYNVTPEPLT